MFLFYFFPQGNNGKNLGNLLLFLETGCSLSMEQRTQVLPFARTLSSYGPADAVSSWRRMYVLLAGVPRAGVLEIIGSLRLRLKKDKTFTSCAHDSNDWRKWSSQCPATLNLREATLKQRKFVVVSHASDAINIFFPEPIFAYAKECIKLKVWIFIFSFYYVGERSLIGFGTGLVQTGSIWCNMWG